MIQLIQARLPHCALRNDPVFGRLQRPWRQPIGSHAPALFRADEAAFFQHTEVLRKGRQRHVEGRGQFTYRRRAVAQPFKYGPAGRVRQGIEDSIELYYLVRHMPNYIPPSNVGQGMEMSPYSCRPEW